MMCQEPYGTKFVITIKLVFKQLDLDKLNIKEHILIKWESARYFTVLIIKHLKMICNYF